MDHETIQEQQIVDRYLAGRLSVEEKEAFEEHYFSCPACFEQVELADALQSGLKQAAAEEAATAVERLGLIAWLVKRGRTYGPFFATLMLAAIVTPLFFLNQKLERARADLEQARRPQINTPLLSLQAERGGSGTTPSTRLWQSPEPSWINMSLGLPIVEHETYRVTLLGEAGKVLWQNADLHPSPLDTLTVLLHSSAIPPGDYTVRVEGAATDFVLVANYAFRVLSPATE